MRPMIDSRTPARSSGTSVEVEALAVVAHEGLDGGRDRPRRRRLIGGLGVAHGVPGGLADRLDEGVEVLVHRPVAGDDELDRHAMQVLDLA